MRVRTGRFVGLRLVDKSGDSQLVEEAVRQRDVEGHRRVVPPPPPVASDLPGGGVGHPAGDQLAVDDLATLPVLELDGAEAVANPPVEVVKHARGLRQPEVGLPARQIAAEACTFAEGCVRHCAGSAPAHAPSCVQWPVVQRAGG